MTRCSFCKHPQREEYERKIASKELTMSSAAQLMDSNKATVSRHMRNCFPKKVAEWIKPEAAKEETLNVVNALLESRERVLSIYNEARQTGDMRAAIQALQCEVSQLTLMGKLTGQLSDAPQVNFLLNPEFVRLKQILIKTLEPYPDVRLKLSEALTEIANDGN